MPQSVSPRLDRVPPHSEEAERGALGAVLLDGVVVLHHFTEKRVEPEAFYIPAHRTIFEVMREMAKEGRPIDTSTVHERLSAKGLLDRVGGFTSLDRLIDATPTAAHAPYYIGIIDEKYRLRQVIENARHAERACYEDTASNDIIASLVSRVSDIGIVTEVREDPRERHRRLRREIQEGRPSGMRIQYGKVDKLLGPIRDPHNIVVAAGTSTGKTAFVANAAVHFAMQGCRVSWHENDMSQHDLELRMAGMISGVNTHIFNYPGFSPVAEAQLEEGWEALRALPIRFDDRRMTMDEIETWAISEKAKHGTQLYVFDFLGKIKRTKDEWRHPLREVVSDWSARCCEIGKRHKAATIVMAQFSRSGNKEKTKTPEHPTLECLKETGDIENNADVVILLSYKPGQPVELFTAAYPVWDIDCDVAKNRNGPRGMVEMCLHNRTQRFVSREQGDDLRRELKGSE